MVSASYPSTSNTWWEIQSVDTMKISRDSSEQILKDPATFRPVIDKQMNDIAQLGATHVAIGTPYDEQFYPVLALWVDSARSHNLKIWFRGNFSGWEEWFGYAPINRQEHTRLLGQFLQNHPELFMDGDLFTPCPECENGGPGDPRMNGDAKGHAQFLIEEYQLTDVAFKNMKKSVRHNLHSMNGDVAELIMTPQNTKALGGVITVDHYVRDPETLTQDTRQYARHSGGQVMLGEYGAPIPDIHGDFSPEEQAVWIDTSLSQLAKIPDLIGLNYWVNVGGSTALWNDNGTARPGVEVLKKYFSPQVYSGRVVDFGGDPIEGVILKSAYKTVQTDKEGNFSLAYLRSQDELHITAPTYYSQNTTFEDAPAVIHMQQQPLAFTESVVRIVQRFLKNFFDLFTR